MKKFAALFLVLTLVVGLASTAFAFEGDKKVTIHLACLSGGKSMEPKGIENGNYDDLNPANRFYLESFRNLVPGYDITLAATFYENVYQQIPLLLAAGDVPDIVLTQTFDFMQYIDTGMFVDDLRPLLEQYGQTCLRDIKQSSWDAVTVGGKIKAIPTENVGYKFVTIIRTDWLEKLGIPFKETYTLSELKDILIRFTNEDPDGNGKNDTYGIGCRVGDEGWDRSFISILGSFGGQVGQNYLYDDTIKPYVLTDDFRGAMEYLAELWQLGAVDKEIFILPKQQARMAAGNGRAGFYCGWWSSIDTIKENGLFENYPDAYFKHIFITSDDGKTSGVRNNGEIWKTVMISNTCESPECAMAVINHVYETYNTSDMTYQYEDGGMYVHTDPEHPTMYNRKRTPGWEHLNDISLENLKKYGTEVPDAVNYAQGARTGLFSEYCFSLKSYAIRSEREWAEEKSAEEMASRIPIDDEIDKADILVEKRSIEENLPMYQDIFYGYPKTEDYVQYQPNIDTLMKEWVVYFVTGEKPINDETWAQYKADYAAKGGQAILTSMTNEYNEMNGTDYKAMNITGK